MKNIKTHRKYKVRGNNENTIKTRVKFKFNTNNELIIKNTRKIKKTQDILKVPRSTYGAKYVFKIYKLEKFQLIQKSDLCGASMQLSSICC